MKLSIRLGALIFPLALLSACLSGGEEVEINLNLYFFGPLAPNPNQSKLSEGYKRFLLPITKPDVCGGDSFTPIVKFARLDTEIASLFEGGKISASRSASGIDGVLGTKIDPAESAKLVDSAIETWKLSDVLYALPVAKAQAPDYLKLIERDKLAIVVFVSANATLNSSVVLKLKESLGKKAPILVDVGTSDQDVYQQKTLKELCSLREKSKDEKINVGVFFLTESTAPKDPTKTAEKKTVSEASSANQLPVPQTKQSIKATAPPPATGKTSREQTRLQDQLAAQQKEIDALRGGKVGSFGGGRAAAAESAISAPQPPSTNSIASNASRQMTAREQCQQKDRTFVGQSLCETRTCERDPSHIDTAFCKALREKSKAQSLNN